VAIVLDNAELVRYEVVMVIEFAFDTFTVKAVSMKKKISKIDMTANFAFLQPLKNDFD